MFNKVNGTTEVYRIMKEDQYMIWKLIALHQKERAHYLIKTATLSDSIRNEIWHSLISAAKF